MALDSLITAIRDFQLVYVSLRLDLPSLLAAGPRRLDELVRATHVPEERLVRLLRGLLWAELIEKTPEGFSLTEDGEQLIDTSPGSLASDLLFQGHFFYSSWGRLCDFATEGKNPFAAAHGEGVFDLIGRSPELARLFGQSMSARTVEFSAEIAALPALAGCGKLVDVAGGEGRLALDLLRVHPAMRAVVFDLPVVKVDAERLIRKESMQTRCEFVGGDLFASVPQGGDVYLLKWILHDWGDPEALSILRTLRKNMGEQARLIVIERVMPEAIEEGTWLAEADLNMLCLNGGAERTERAMKTLFEQADFALESVSELADYERFHAFTAVPAPSPEGGSA